MKGSLTKTIYSARSQFWVGNAFFKPIDMGGRAIEEGDPILRGKLRDHFEPYEPTTRDYPGRLTPEKES